MPTTPKALATETLEAVADDLALPAEFARRYVSHGEPAWDCEQLTVHLLRLRPKITGAADACVLTWIAALKIVFLQCVPVADDSGESPARETLAAEYGALLDKGWAIAKGLSRRWAQGMWPTGVSCKGVSFNPLEPFTPQGGLGGWSLTVEVQLT